MKTNIQYRVRSSKIKIFPSLNQNFQRFQVSLNVDCSTRKDRDIYIYIYTAWDVHILEPGYCMSHWKSAPYIAPASISGSLNLSGGFFGSSIRQSPNFPLKSIEFNEFKRKIEIIFSSFQYFSILFVYYTR